jgi:hypothetical protein
MNQGPATADSSAGQYDAPNAEDAGVQLHRQAPAIHDRV